MSACAYAYALVKTSLYRALGKSRKLGGAAKHLIDGSEKRICRLSFEFCSSDAIERRSNVTFLVLCAWTKY